VKEMDNNFSLQELKRFLIDIDCLRELEQTSFNIFDVLKISRAEIRHSNVLAWLLDPNGNHGYSQGFLALLNSYLARDGFVSEKDVFKLLTMKYSDVVVLREWQNIDILIESKEEKYVLCIENKVDTQDHSGQLDRYYDIVENKYNDYTKVYLYLTPEGIAPLQDNNSAWGCIKYETIIDIISITLKKNPFDSEASQFIRSYLKTLRRETMNNQEIVKLCQEIYKEHKVALDMIFENRPDRLQNVYEIFKAWAKKKDNEGIICWDEEKSSKSYVRFTTPFMNGFIKESNGISGWNTKNHYYYEITSYCDKNDDIKYAIQLSFNSSNLEKCNKEQIEDLIKFLQPNKTLKENWQWKTAFKSKTSAIKNDEILPEFFDDPDEKNDIFDSLDKMLEAMLNNEEKIKENF
jgi:hypothetical protein